MGLRVLLVQSDQKIAWQLIRLLNQKEDQAWIAWDLGQALSLIQQTTPNLILMDLHYPGDDWLVFLRQVRNLNPKMKIILTQKSPDLQRELAVRQYGINNFIRYPFTRRWLGNALDALEGSDKRLALPLKPAEPDVLQGVRVPMSIKIILPYLLLSLALALGAAFVVSQLLLQAEETRFYNQLAANGLQSANWMVREEQHLLSTIRLISNTQGFVEAAADANTDVLRQICVPLATNTADEAVVVLDYRGTSIFSMMLQPGDPPGKYSFSKGENYFGIDFIRPMLNGAKDERGDKYTGLVRSDRGGFLFIGSPIRTPENRLVAVLLVGRPIASLAAQMQKETLSEVTFYDLQGQPLVSTLFTKTENYPLDTKQENLILTSQDQQSMVRTLAVGGKNFSELLGPWEVRGGNDIGFIGISMVQTYLVRASQITRLQVIILVSGGILLVIMVGIYLANSFTHPLKRLAKASVQVGKGDLGVKVESNGNDEVAALAHTFNFMVAGLQEGLIYRDLLGRTVSPELREQIRLNFDSGSLRLEGQQTIATVFVSNIHGFTSITEGIEPVKVFEWLNEYFGVVIPIINSHDGVVSRLEGDSLVAIFGILPIPLPAEESSREACRAAVEILQAIEDINFTRSGRGETPLLTGIGINTGMVMAGGLDSPDWLHYTVLGETVNTTFSLEVTSREFSSSSGIVVSQTTFKSLGSFTAEFRLDPQGLWILKGKAERLMIYRLLPSKTSPEIRVML